MLESMMCPNCTERLSPTDASGIQTYSCRYCNGIWVPENSIAALLKVEHKAVTSKELVDTADFSKESKKQCAACSNQNLQVIQLSGVAIDACPKCYGIFFDPKAISSVFPVSHKPQKEVHGVGQYVATEGIFWLIIAFFSGS